jgi:hypothetical protein
VFPAILDGEVGDGPEQRTRGRGDPDRSRCGCRLDPLRGVHSAAEEVAPVRDHLPGVQADPHLQTGPTANLSRSRHRSLDRNRAIDCTARRYERHHVAVARRLHFVPAVLGQF